MTAPLRLIFMGTPAVAVPVLAALLAAGHDIAAVYTQPPRPAGRGKTLRPSPVQEFAQARGLGVRHPATLKDPVDQQALAALNADAAVVIAYGLLLPRPVLAAPRLGCFNLHASLLPRWRGAAPIERAILAGDSETGMCVMGMEVGLDTGPVYAVQAVPIGPRTTSRDLRVTLGDLGARMMVEALSGIDAGRLHPVPQPVQGVTYAQKIDKGEGRIDWRLPAADLDRLVRALGEAPGTWFDLAGERVKVLAAETVDGSGTPGTLLDDTLAIACGAGALRLLRVQRPGKGPVDARAFLNGARLVPGARLV
jgi:methionyl-tRNA formyltransferase